MSELVKVYVNYDDISYGRARTVEYCPVALALKRKLGIKCVSVQKSGVTTVDRQGRIVNYVPNPAMLTFVDQVDRQQVVWPKTLSMRRIECLA